MDFVTPLKTITIASTALTSVAQLSYGPYNSTSGLIVAEFVVLFLLTWTILFWSWAVYRVFLKPQYLSRLRTLPEPTVRLSP